MANPTDVKVVMTSIPSTVIKVGSPYNVPNPGSLIQLNDTLISNSTTQAATANSANALNNNIQSLNLFTQSAYNEANLNSSNSGAFIATAAFNQANTGTILAQAAFNQANTSNGNYLPITGGTLTGGLTVILPNDYTNAISLNGYTGTVSNIIEASNNILIKAGPQNSNILQSDVGFTVPTINIGYNVVSDAKPFPLFMNNVLTGTYDKDYSCIFVQTFNDSLNVGTSGAVAGITVNQSFGGSNTQGDRLGIVASTALVNTTNNLQGSQFAALQGYTGAAVNDNGTASNSAGALWGINTVSTLGPNCSYWGVVVGYEMDMHCEAGCSVDGKVGIALNLGGVDAVQGTKFDAGLAFGGGQISPGWDYVISIGNPGGYGNVVAIDGWILGFINWVDYPPDRPIYGGGGLDFSLYYPSDSYIRGPSFIIDGNGNFSSSNSVTGNTITSNTYISSAYTKINKQNTNYTLHPSDNGLVVLMNNTTTMNVNVSTNLPIGFQTTITSVNTGNVTIVAGPNTTINITKGTQKTISGQWNTATIFCWSANNFILDGSII